MQGADGRAAGVALLLLAALTGSAGFIAGGCHRFSLLTRALLPLSL